jgi:hypothetical protein
MLGAKLGTGSLIGRLAEGVSRGIGENVGVSRRTLKKVGMKTVTPNAGGKSYSPIASGMRRTKVIGPKAGNSNTANMITGQGATRRFVSNKNFAQMHEARGRNIIGAGLAVGTVGFVNRDANKKSYYTPPRPTAMGSGRFA